MRLEIEYHGDGEAQFGAFARVFAQAFGRGLSHPVPANGFAGRILRGADAASFEWLSDDPRRRLVFLLDGEGLSGLVGLGGADILRHIGYDEHYIMRLVARGTRFKLVLIPSATLVLATWDNLLALAGEVYPEWAERIACAAPELSRLSYDEALAAGGEVAAVRAFLRDELNVNALFAGDGYTRHPDDPDVPRCAEYIARNRPLADFGSRCLIEFPVVLP